MLSVGKVCQHTFYQPNIFKRFEFDGRNFFPVIVLNFVSHFCFAKNDYSIRASVRFIYVCGEAENIRRS